MEKLSIDEKWKLTTDAMRRDIKNFEIKSKNGSILQRFLCKILFFFHYKDVYTAWYPNVYMPITTQHNRIYNYRAFQHEWVHFKDNETMMNLLPLFPKKMNIGIFSILYAFPQCLAILSLLAIFSSLWWLLCLLLLLPLPAPFRWYAEIRAYRRSVELGGDPELIAKGLASSKYYFCMPIKSLTIKMLKKESPYMKEMNEVTK